MILLELVKVTGSMKNGLQKKYIENTLNNRGFHFTAFVDGKIAGSIMVVEEDIPKFWIFYFIVDKNYRRTGIGTASSEEGY